MRPPIALLALCLTACATPEQIAARRAYEAEQHRRASEAYTEHLAAQCQGIGYERFSDGWKQCLLQLHQQAQAERAQIQGIMLQNAIRQQQQRSYQPPAPRHPTFTNCSRDYWGNVSCTHH